jgi:DNA polymerase
MPDTRIHVDWETRSLIDLIKLGSAIYAQHWSTSPLMLALVVGKHEEIIDLMGANPDYARTRYPFCGENDPFLNCYKVPVPPLVQQAIDEDWIFVAHNARFEQDIWREIAVKQWGWPFPRHWSCTMARARYWGLRGSLDGAASDLELPLQKMKTGGDYIKTFSVPRKYKGAKRDGIVTQLWAEPYELPNDWNGFKDYCLQDARVEKQLDEVLTDLPPFEQAVWELDYTINSQGVPIDRENVFKAIHFSDHYTQSAVQRFNDITGINPTQREKVLEYINAREEIMDLPNLQSKTLSRLNHDNFSPELKDVINIRLDCSRASVKKLQAMVDNTSDDGYARGLFMYYGAHTGRWSGKRLQPHNFIRGNSDHARIMFDFLDNGSWTKGIGKNGLPMWINDADMLFPRPLMSLSHAMRGFIKAPDGKSILSGDYAQIEARVLAWLANCESLLNSFTKGEDTYVRFAADHMYRRDYNDYFDACGKVYEYMQAERQRAKSAVLGCGFQLGAKGFQLYCDSLDIIISLEEAEFIVKAYRDAHPEISDYNTGLWSRTNYCAIDAVDNEGDVVSLYGTEITFHVERLDHEKWWLVCTLPSGRHIAYYRPKTDELNQWGKPKLTFRTEWKGRFSQREDTYGGKLVENIVQGVARDICAIGAMNAAKAGFDVRALVHDEVVTINGDDSQSAKDHLKECLLDVPKWCMGLPLDAEVKAMQRYAK